MSTMDGRRAIKSRVVNNYWLFAINGDYVLCCAAVTLRGRIPPSLYHRIYSVWWLMHSSYLIDWKVVDPPSTVEHIINQVNLFEIWRYPSIQQTDSLALVCIAIGFSSSFRSSFLKFSYTIIYTHVWFSLTPTLLKPSKSARACTLPICCTTYQNVHSHS